MTDSGNVLEHHTNNAVGMFGIDLKLVCVQIRTREGANIKQAACKPWVGVGIHVRTWHCCQSEWCEESDEEIESVIECTCSNHFCCCMGLGVVSQCDTCIGGRDTD